MYHMNTAEMMVLYKLNQYKDPSSNKDRFILPEDVDISLFTNVIDDAFNWFENIEDVSVPSITVSKEEKGLPKKSGKFEKNLVYMLTSPIHLENRMYIIGKSKNLNSRLSSYNKGVDHDVIYTKKCKNVEQLNVVELMILYKLDEYRERANRDRFILPDEKDVDFFMSVFDDAVGWFDNIDVEIVKDEELKEQNNKDSRQNYRELNVDSKRETDKKYREENRDKILKFQKSYRETHKKEVSDGKKNWYVKNKEKVIERVKKNYKNNKGKKIEKVKEYSIKNKDKIKDRTTISVQCECGLTIRKYGMGKHLQTNIHKINMDKIIQDF
jgi:hypothetical protein